MQEHVQEIGYSPHQIGFLVRWLKERIRRDEGAEWGSLRLGGVCSLWGERGVWSYRKEGKDEYGFSVQSYSPASERAVPLGDAAQAPSPPFGSLTMYRATDNSTAIIRDGCTDQWRPYFGMLLEEMKRPSLAVGAPQHQRPSQHEGANPEAPEPWEVIPNPKARSIVEMWSEDVPTEQIAEQLEMKEKSVLNRISDLRRIYGEEVVPYRRRPGEEYSWQDEHDGIAMD